MFQNPNPNLPLPTSSPPSSWGEGGGGGGGGGGEGGERLASCRPTANHSNIESRKTIGNKKCGRFYLWMAAQFPDP